MRGQKGYSFIEMMVAVGIASIVGLGIASVAGMVGKYFVNVSEQYRTLESLSNASFHLKAVFSQAVEMRTVGAISAGNVTGEILDVGNDGAAPFYAFNDLGLNGGGAMPAVNQVAAIAAFPREVGQGSPSRIRETGVFFQTPASAGGTHFTGVLFIDHGDGDGIASPTAGSAVSFDRMAEFEVVNIDLTAGAAQRVRAVEFRMVARYFGFSGEKRDWQWCPSNSDGDADLGFSGQVGACPENVSFTDIERRVKVTLRNNRINIPGVSVEPFVSRPFGNVYFYQPLNFMNTAGREL